MQKLINKAWPVENARFDFPSSFSACASNFLKPFFEKKFKPLIKPKLKIYAISDARCSATNYFLFLSLLEVSSSVFLHNTLHEANDWRSSSSKVEDRDRHFQLEGQRDSWTFKAYSMCLKDIFSFLWYILFHTVNNWDQIFRILIKTGLIRLKRKTRYFDKKISCDFLTIFSPTLYDLFLDDETKHYSTVWATTTVDQGKQSKNKVELLLHCSVVAWLLFWSFSNTWHFAGCLAWAPLVPKP